MKRRGFLKILGGAAAVAPFLPKLDLETKVEPTTATPKRQAEPAYMHHHAGGHVLATMCVTSARYMDLPSDFWKRGR